MEGGGQHGQFKWLTRPISPTQSLRVMVGRQTDDYSLIDGGEGVHLDSLNRVDNPDLLQVTTTAEL